MIRLIVLAVVIFYGGYLVGEIPTHPTDAQYGDDPDYTFMLLGFFTWVVAIIATFIWYLWGRSAEDIGEISRSMFQGAKKCRYCLKSLPSVWTAKCPHCTADL